VKALRDKLRADSGAGELESVQAAFDVELKDYQKKTHQQIQKLQQDVQAATAAVESFAGSVNESEINLESGIKRELNSLNQAAASNDIEQMRSSNHLAIAQLKDEIRLLHEQVEAASHSQLPDPSSESHQRISGRMEELIKRDTSFSVLLVVVRNLEGLGNCYSPNVIENSLRNFQSCFENILPSSAIVDRWARDQFAAILSPRPGNAIELSNDVVRKLSGPFLERDKGGMHSILFSPRAGVIEFSPGSDWPRFQTKLKKLAEALNS